MSLKIKPSASGSELSSPHTLTPVALGTALVLVTYVTPMVTVARTATALDAGAAARAWILSSTSVGLAAALLVTGVLGDTFGRRRVYLGGLVALAVGAVACAVAPDVAVFIGARILQGAGGAAILSCGLAALAQAYPPGPARVRATSVWGGSVGIGIAVGAVLASALDLGSGWRETYAVTAVLALALVVPTRRAVVESSADQPRRLDLPGLALLVVGMSLLVTGVTQSRSGFGAVTLALLIGSVVALAGFALVERRVREPLLDPELLGSVRFRSAAGGSLLLGLGIIATASFVPTLTQVGLGTGLWTGSLLVLVWAMTSFLTSLLLWRLPGLAGPGPIAVLLLVVAGGLLLGFGLSDTSSPVRLVWPMLVTGIPTGMLNGLLGREAVASVPPDRAAMSSGANNTARYLGAACGITLFVIIATHVGPDVIVGWNTALVVAAAITAAGAGLIALGALPRRGHDRGRR